jgi:uncharacterized membrane protein
METVSVYTLCYCFLLCDTVFVFVCSCLSCVQVDAVVFSLCCFVYVLYLLSIHPYVNAVTGHKPNCS